MRVTNKMMVDRVSFNTQTSLARYLEMQTRMSSGRRINKPSDDPLGIQRDLDYRTELAKNSQYLSNAARAQEWSQNYDSVLADVGDLLSSTREIAVAMASEVADDDGTSRRAALNEVQQMFDQLIQLANSEIEDKYIFSGFRTDERAIIASANGARYNGDYGQINFQIDTSTDMAVNMIGADVYLNQLSIMGENGDLNVAVTPATLLADLYNGDGIDQLPGTISITDQNLGITTNIDLSGASTIQDALLAINAALTAGGITNLTAAIGDANNSLLLDTTENGLISSVTSLDVINSGSGVDLSTGKIRVTDYAAVDFEVDLSGCSTIGDVITEFNTQVATAGVSNVTMQINAAGTGFEINDSNGVPLGLSIAEIDAVNSVAEGLGIAGQIDPTLMGDDLDPAVSFLIEDVGGTTAEDLGILAEFFHDFSGSDLDPMLTTTSNVSDLNGGVGFELGEIRLCQGEFTRTVDLNAPSIVTIQDMLDAINNCGLDITASLNSDQRGFQIVNNDPTRSLTVDDVGAGLTSKQLGIYGSSDLLGSYIALMNALEADDQEGVGLLLGNFESAIDRTLDHRASMGAKAIRLESTESRLIDREYTFTKRLSEIEDADMTQLITDLTTYENNYQAALYATSAIIQSSLLDFLR